MRARALIAPILAIAAAIVARRGLDVVEVRGRSMAPTLLPGDRLLVARLPGRPGDIVLAADPRDGTRELIKRVASVDAGRVALRGDNPAASTDARSFGSVGESSVRWRVLARYWPPKRAGTLPPARPLTIDEGGETACTFPQALIAGE